MLKQISTSNFCFDIIIIVLGKFYPKKVCHTFFWFLKPPNTIEHGGARICLGGAKMVKMMSYIQGRRNGKTTQAVTEGVILGEMPNMLITVLHFVTSIHFLKL